LHERAAERAAITVLGPRRPGRASGTSHASGGGAVMLDLLLVMITALFFAATLAYLRACERI
jgi:hypothetical protein